MDPNLAPKAIKYEKLYLHCNFLGFYYIETYLVSFHEGDVYKNLTIIKICIFISQQGLCMQKAGVYNYTSVY